MNKEKKHKLAIKGSGIALLTALFSVPVILQSCARPRPAKKIESEDEKDDDKNKNLNSQKIKDIEAILNNGNLNIPSNFKTYLISLKNNDDLLNNINTQSLKQNVETVSSLINEKDHLDKSKLSSQYKNFLNQITNTNIDSEITKENEYIKNIDVNNESSVKYIDQNIKAIEATSNSIKEYNKSASLNKLYFDNLLNLLNANNSVFSDEMKNQVINEKTVEAYKKDNSLTELFNKYQTINTKANQLLEIKRSLENKANKNQQQTDLLNEIKALFNENKIKNDQLNDANIISKIENLINKANQISQSDEGERNRINSLRQAANNYIDTLSNLSDELKNAYKEKINTLSLESLINEVKQRAEQFNSLATQINNAINNANEVKKQAKYTNATNKTEFDQKLAELNGLVSNNKLLNNSEYIENSNKIAEINTTINELSYYSENLNGQEQEQHDDRIETFKRQVEEKLRPAFNSGVTAYNLENSIYSVNINEDNRKLFLADPVVYGVELTYKNMELVHDDINQLKLTYSARDKNDKSLVSDVSKIFSFNTNFNDEINKLQYENLDALFDINYDDLKNSYENTFLSSDDLKNKYFNAKFSNLHGYFTYRLKLSSFAYTNSKLSVDVEFLVKDRIVKTLTLQTNESFEFKDAFWDDISISAGSKFKDSTFYQNPDGILTEPGGFDNFYAQGSGFNIWFVLNVFNQFKNKISELQNKNIATRVSDLTGRAYPTIKNPMSLEEVSRVYNDFKNNDEEIRKLFNIQISAGASYELIDYSDTQRFLAEGNNATFKFRITKNSISKELTTKLTVKIDDESIQDVKDLKEIRKILEIENDQNDALKSSKKLLSLIRVKTPGKTHNQMNAKDAIDAFNELYEFPKIGKYEIYAKELISYNNFIDSSFGGEAKIFFWIKKEGTPITFQDIQQAERIYKPKYTKTIRYFKPLSYLDIKPSNTDRWFEQGDFASSNISEEDKRKINQINSHNFEVRKATGAIVSGRNFDYTVIDPKDIVDQNAANMLNYLLKLKTSNREDTSHNSEFVNKNPDAGSRDDQPLTNNANKSGDFWVSSLPIVNPSDTSNAVDLSAIERNYFIYYYDVQNPAPNELSFKLGFISKTDTTKRYSNGNTITLKNLRNDYKENLYPEILLNSITYNDLNINNISNTTISQFTSIMKGSDRNSKQSYVSLNKDITYKNFAIPKSNFEVFDVKAGEGNSVYVRFKVTNPTTNKTYQGNTWYKITGFSDRSSAKEQLTFKHSSLHTVFESATQITRTRELEPYYEDLLWEYDKETQAAKWTLKEKYIKNTFLKENTSNRKFKLILYANQLIQDDFRLLRISDPSRNYSFDFDFEQLASGQEITKTQVTKTYNDSYSRPYPKITFTLKARYQAGEGIKFEVKLTDSQYKLFVGNPYNEAIAYDEAREGSPRYGEFKNEKAFLINNSGASITIEYTNQTQHENFNQETNLFDYKKLDYSQENQPILFYTPESVVNSDEYNPNQNVPYELHNGYLQDQEYFHSAWENIDIVKNVRARSFAFNQGTATILAKVSKDPKDGRFYIITNNHVEHIDNISEVQGDNLPKKAKRNYITKTSNNFGNNVDNGFSYWGGLDVANSVPIEVIWSGVDQVNEKGAKHNGLTVDVTVFAVDVKPLIANARAEGKLELAEWFENWFKLDDAKMDYYGSKDGVHFGPNLKKMAMSGFPYGKQAGYLLNRASSNSGNISLARQNGYVQTFYNAGNSGTGVLGQNNSYVSTINSGAPLTFLQSWNYETGFYNFLGVNLNNQNPLELKNVNSVGAQILRWNLKDPSNIKLPWFYKDIENK